MNTINWREVPERDSAEGKSMEHQDAANEAAFEKAAELLGKPLELPLGPGEPASGRLPSSGDPACIWRFLVEAGSRHSQPCSGVSDHFGRPGNP